MDSKLVAVLSVIVLVLATGFGDQESHSPDPDPPGPNPDPLELPKHGIRIPAIVRKHLIGTLYNATTGRFYETLPFSDKIPDECYTIIPINHTWYDASLVSSSREKLSSMTLDAEAQLGIMSGLVQIDGKVAADWSRQSRVKEVQSVVLSQITTFEIKLNPHCSKLTPVLVRKVLESTDANYIVTSVILGVRYAIKFKQRTVTNSENLDVAGSFGARMEKLAFNFKAALEGSYESSNQDEFQDISITVEGDIDPPSKFLTGFDEALNYFKEVSGNISEYRKTNNGTAIFYVATPLDDVLALLEIDRKAEFVKNVDLKGVQEALTVFDHAEDMYNEGMFIDSQLKLRRKCFAASSSRGLTSALIKYGNAYGEFRLNVSKAIQFERRGKQHAVMSAVSMYLNHEYSPYEFQKMLDEDYKYYLDMLTTVQELQDINAPACPPASA